MILSECTSLNYLSFVLYNVHIMHIMYCVLFVSMDNLAPGSRYLVQFIPQQEMSYLVVLECSIMVEFMFQLEKR